VRRAARIAAATAVLALAVTSAPTAALATARASLTDIEDEVMCVACHTPLAVSQSPQGNAERDYIRSLIAQGETKAQIKQALVAQYGQAVLALPGAHGFNLTVYILPPALVLAGLATLAITLPRWRRRTRAAQPAAPANGPQLEPSEMRRLDEDLIHFD
jgi:cytochrome c-type biogenesis protein CcmH/NrfF